MWVIVFFGLFQAPAAVDSIQTFRASVGLRRQSHGAKQAVRLPRVEATYRARVGASGSALLRRQSHDAKQARFDRAIWCYYEYPHGPSPLVELNMETWRHHGPELTLHLVNDSNVRNYVPDLPEEYFMLPYASAKSDVLRAALLYHHGGIYIDNDFVVARPLREVYTKLEDYDVVSYSDETDADSGTCGRHYSSNFMAARKGNSFCGTWWSNLKEKLRAECAKGMFREERVCCHVSGESHDKCHIPWASLEHMKELEVAAAPRDGATRDWTNGSSFVELGGQSAALTSTRRSGLSSRSSLAIEFIDKLPADLRMYCFRGKEGMTPHINGEIYHQHWLLDDSGGHTGNSSDDDTYDRRFDCRAEGMEISCKRGNWGHNQRRVDNFFGRIAYHLFFSTAAFPAKSRNDVFDKSWLVTELYRRSLGIYPRGKPGERDRKGQASRDPQGTAPLSNTIWCYYNYPSGPNPFVSLNIETWRRHAPHMRVVFVNDSNAKDLIPDLPDEFFRLGYAAAKSDVMRAAVLYHHGGLYMDTDFILSRPVNGILEKLRDYDVVSYSDSTTKGNGDCALDHFSSNFIAGRKGNPFSATWWSNLKAGLRKTCSKDAWSSKSRLCCHVEGETPEASKPRECHIPWAALEHLKNPADNHAFAASVTGGTAMAAAGTSNSLLVPEFIHNLPGGVRLYCFAGDDSFAPHLNGEVFWQPWAADQTAMHKLSGVSGKGARYENRFSCRRQGSDLHCTSGTWGRTVRHMPNFFGRQAYHLFFTTGRRKAATRAEVLNMDWLVSDMYKRALGLT